MNKHWCEEDGFYYTQTGKDRIMAIDFYDKESNTWLLNSDKDMPPFKVLTPVPTYEELQTLKEYEKTIQSFNGMQIDYTIACETVNKLLDEKGKLKEENARLKDKLKKECGYREATSNLFSQLSSDYTELEQKNHILTESQMKLENTIGKLGKENESLKEKIEEREQQNAFECGVVMELKGLLKEWVEAYPVVAVTCDLKNFAKIKELLDKTSEVLK